MSCSCAERASSLTAPSLCCRYVFFCPSTTHHLAVSLIPLFFLAHPRPSYCYRLHLTVQSTSPSLLPCLPPRLRHGARGTGKGSLTTGVATLTSLLLSILYSSFSASLLSTSYSLLCLCPSCRRHPQLPPHRLPHFCPALIVSKVVAGQ